MNVQWFPGHMVKALKEIYEKQKMVDMLIEIVDSRAPLSSRNPELVNINKPRLIVMSKKDYADSVIVNEWIKHFTNNEVKVVCQDLVNGFNIKEIINACNELMKAKFERDARRGIKNRTIRAMVVGIPNVGKSTFINKLAKRKAAKAGNQPGVTKSQQWVKTENIELLDTPGVLWPKFESKDIGIKLALIGTIKEEILNNDDLSLMCVNFLNEYYPDYLKKRYDVEIVDENVFENIAKRRNLLLSNNRYDIDKAKYLLLKEFKEGIIGKVCVERPGVDYGIFRVWERI